MHGDKPEGKRWEDVVWEKHRYNDRTVIKSGSYLTAYCPHCGASVVEGECVRLETRDEGGRAGSVELRPYLNLFEGRCDLRLREGHDVADLRCPHCGASLRAPDHHCGEGHARVARLAVGVATARMMLLFCLSGGCAWHRLDPDDEHRMILDASQEW